MMKEMTVESVENRFDEMFKSLDMLTDDLYEKNSYSLKQIYEAYEESKQ